MEDFSRYTAYYESSSSHLLKSFFLFIEKFQDEDIILIISKYHLALCRNLKGCNMESYQYGTILYLTDSMGQYYTNDKIGDDTKILKSIKFERQNDDLKKEILSRDHSLKIFIKDENIRFTLLSESGTTIKRKYSFSKDTPDPTNYLLLLMNGINKRGRSFGLVLDHYTPLTKAQNSCNITFGISGGNITFDDGKIMGFGLDQSPSRNSPVFHINSPVSYFFHFGKITCNIISLKMIDNNLIVCLRNDSDIFSILIPSEKVVEDECDNED